MRLDTNYHYTGQQFDPISELYSLRARYYDASLGRFLSRDTYPYDYQNPFELNRYVYAANNPATYTDPSGHFVGFAINTAKSFIAARGASIAMGALSGSVIGGLSSVFMWNAFIKTGQCGDFNITFEQYVRTNMIIGAAFGALIGALPPSLAMGVAQTGNYGGMIMSLFDVANNGPTVCNMIGFFAGFTGAVGGNLAPSTPITFPFELPNFGILEFIGSFNSAGALKFSTVLTIPSLDIAIAGVAGLESLLSAPLLMSNPNPQDTGNDNGDDGGGSSNSWKPGDALDAPIDGSPPSWETVRERYWQTEEAFRGSEYGPRNRYRMKELGRAPQAQVEVRSKSTGDVETRWVSMELHHLDGRGIGPNDPLVSDINNLLPVWPWEHDALDTYRNTGYEVIRIITDAANN